MLSIIILIIVLILAYKAAPPEKGPAECTDTLRSGLFHFLLPRWRT
jgi:hypothetical protein